MHTRVTIIGLVALSVLLGGCTHVYHPAEYGIAEERIAGLPAGTPVRIVGEPPATNDQVIMTAGPNSWVTNYSEVTAALVAQLTKEMTKRGQPVSDSASKTIRLTVLSFKARYAGPVIQGFMLLRLQLGAAQPRDLAVVDNSMVHLYLALNGTIARAVIEILSDPDVRAFLGDMPASADSPERLIRCPAPRRSIAARMNQGRRAEPGELGHWRGQCRTSRSRRRPKAGRA